MTENLPVQSKDKLPATGIIGRAFGWCRKLIMPYAVFLSNEATARYAALKAAIATQEAIAHVFEAERTEAARVKGELIKQLPGADPARRLQIMASLRELDGHLNTVNVLRDALPYLAERPVSPEANEDAESGPSDAWFDRFQDLSRRNNEPWRRDLLARSLAIETANPGSFDLRHLWSIGTLSDNQFHGFAQFLDAASQIGLSQIGGEPFIEVGCLDDFYHQPLPKDTLVKGCTEYGNLVVDMLEAGLIYDPPDAQISTAGVHKEVPAGRTTVLRYGDAECSLTASRELVVNGMLCTSLGRCIASLYSAKQTPLGQEMFDRAVRNLVKKGFQKGGVQAPVG